MNVDEIQEEVSGEVEEQPTNEVQLTQPEQTTPTAPAPQYTPEQYADAVLKAQQNQPAPPKELTQEEINQRMRVWKADDQFGQEFVNALTPDDDGRLSPAKVAAVIQQMHSKQTEQFQTFAQALANRTNQQFQQTLEPIQQTFTKQQQAETRKAFTTAYPSLKPYENLVTAAAAQLQATGATYSTKEQLFPALANTMEQMIKPINPQFSLANAPSGNSGIAPASVLAGGHGGGGNAPTTTRKSSSIWG